MRNLPSSDTTGYQMDLLKFSFVSTDHLPAIILTTLLLLPAAYFLLITDRRKLPPTAREGTFELVQIFMTGKGVPDFILAKMREVGQVFRLSMPERTHWVTICDPVLARKILLEEDEKPAVYKRFDGFTGRVSTMFSKRTHGEDWHITRKGVASSFSMASISSILPKMHEKIGDMKKMLQQLEKDGTAFSLSQITVNLTMDFISAGKIILHFLITISYRFGT